MSIMFIVISLVFVFGYMGFIKFLWAAMQKWGMFDMILGVDESNGGAYTKWLEKLYIGTPKQKFVEKIMGGCNQCTSFWWFLPFSIPYAVTIYYTTGWNMPTVLIYIWFVIYWFICSLAGLHILTYRNK